MRDAGGSGGASEPSSRPQASPDVQPENRGGGKVNPFAANQRAAKLAQMLPEWAKRAACAELAPNQSPYGPMFDDEVAQKPDPDTYHWPAGVLKAMKLCAGCPVRTECLTYCFESEKREATEWWKGELVPQNRRFGVYGGIPGRVREHYRNAEGCEAWFERWLETNVPTEPGADAMSA